MFDDHESNIALLDISETHAYIQSEREADEIMEKTLDMYMEFEYITESTQPDTFILRDDLYVKISTILNSKSNQDKFKRIVGQYIDRNSNKLHTAGPQYLIPFTDADKMEFFNLFNMTPDEILIPLNKLLKLVNDKADFKLLRNNPIFVLFFCVIRYFTINKNEPMLNNSLIVLALSMYPSMFTKYYEHEPNGNVMQYTIDNLSKKYTIKKTKHVFGMLLTSISSSWNYHQDNLTKGSDKNAVDFIMRIRNDQNSLMKKISNEYYWNHKHNLATIIAADSFDENNMVDVENDSNKVESATNKISIAMLIKGIDIRLAEAAAKSSHVSVVDTRNYLTEILTENNMQDLKSFIESVIFLYLYEQKKSINEINSKDFLIHSLGIYKKTNSNDKNIGNIKAILDKWGQAIGLHDSYGRKATINDYKKAIYVYIVFSIQKYN